MTLDGRHGIPATLRQLADSIEDGAIPVRYFSVSYVEPDVESIAEGDDPDDVTIMLSITTRRATVEIPAAFYTDDQP